MLYSNPTNRFKSNPTNSMVRRKLIDSSVEGVGLTYSAPL
jgi:hypothetical protein